MSSAFNIPAGWREVVESLVRHIEVNECQHEDTYRGGAIWTICRDCDKKWADGRGGFKPYVRPAVLLAADKLLAAAPTPPVDAVPGEPVALPHPGGAEISALLDSILAEYNWPTNTKNAARAGWTAAMRYLAASVASRAGSEPVAWQLQFLTDVVTAAGLLEHGKRDKGLAERIGQSAFRWRKELFAAPIRERAASLVAPEGLSIAQEPKYTVNGSAIVNRASGEEIPADEPVFILRARDLKALPAIAFYGGSVSGGQYEHWNAIFDRLADFSRFKAQYPERMKEPDTDWVSAGEAQS